MTSACYCQIRHAVTDEHRMALMRALTAAEALGQADLAAHYRYRLEPCPAAKQPGPAQTPEVTE
ncbi:uncharacterized protein YciW [Streptacidiphilus sp. MAP12-33]|uniref:hypothetical protein n=1 Tax=Streptacidiphilus sp. MAP12-33 TaxID=3156266 RepID=UPI003512464A